ECERILWHSTARGAQVPQQGDNGRDTVPRQQEAGVPEPRGAHSSQACRPLSSLRSQKERRCRPPTLRWNRQHPRAATETGLSTRLSSKPSPRGHPTAFSGTLELLVFSGPHGVRCCLAPRRRFWFKNLQMDGA
ncbi:hypothetical protein H1C71_026407, partial [Ictidomys tridecemlineatus]